MKHLTLALTALAVTGCFKTEVRNEAAEADAGRVREIEALCDVAPGFVAPQRACGTDVGECILGVQRCTIVGNAPRWGTCDGGVRPIREICDGLDNDCDGEPDDGLDGCEVEVPFGCNPMAFEECNGRDDNCNGAVDEGCECRDELERSCGMSVGVCEPGRQRCSNGLWGDCVGSVSPDAETCDGLDNDCDASEDEDCECHDGDVRPCGEDRGDCTSGEQVCFGGYWSLCDGTPPASEDCDGRDNDCDGDVDEGCPAPDCVSGAERPCGRNTGECTRGFETCNAFGYWGACSGADPDAEACDGLDNDCDGAIDEDAHCECLFGRPPRPCGTDMGLCVRGTQACVDGYWSDCEGGVDPETEICDDFDNDCDGTVDEGMHNACGACGPVPPETCDGLDNDCDGSIDEDCGCREGETQVCGSDVGACVSGMQRCNGGHWTLCDGIMPDVEVCDSLDNDCDGDADEGLLNACGLCGPVPPESCADDLDNDCDGAINESCLCTIGERRSCGSDTGECVAGTQDCVPSGASGRWSDCVGVVGPAPELCDGLDNDCDAALDNGCGCVDGATRSCGTDMGECAGGRQRCVAGFWDVCDPATGFVDASPEVCDGLDNDCDGSLDEDCECVNGSSRECGSFMGICYPDSQLCLDGHWSLCVGAMGESEMCDGLDNDCDGSVDEDCECRRGATRPCGETRGICTRGTQICNPSGFWDECSGVQPETEICDSLDNDCDGDADEGLLNACGLCGPVPPESCADDLDNDCDGMINEGCACTIGETRECGSDVGVCVAGVSTCVPSGASGRWSDCVGDVGPDSEVCDTIDNNCNGYVDEGCACVDGDVQPCGSDVGECALGIQTCVGGSWGFCSGEVGPQPEYCDALDNDCDGDVDESRFCDCLDGEPARACGSDIGACVGGTQACVRGRWQACGGPGFIGPDAESCDGLDNDCDGSRDEDAFCECADGQLAPCGTDVGVCVSGTQACVRGIWLSCAGGFVGPDSEGCDGLDNNCDGRIDEDCDCRDGDTRPCGSDVGDCSRGTLTCSGGRWGFCVGEVGPSPEECDTRDNNCDGFVDNALFCDCRDGESRVCGRDMGECSEGVQQCAGGRWQPCGGPAFVGPTLEVCDNRDNDCDGITDEDANCRCRDGETRECGTDVGECVSGVQTCAAGMWGGCAGDVTPNAEFCDLRDNDCDGDVDEGCGCVDGDVQPCDSDIGECVAGTQVCRGGRWSFCFGPIGPEPEACDGLDNNCDGFVDSDWRCECRHGDVQPCGSVVGECRPGTQTCVAGHWEACGGMGYVSPTTDVCADGLDNDCDGEADEGCLCDPSPGAPSEDCPTFLPGICARGTIRCEAGGHVTRCVPTTFGPPESCGNGLDDNCNGMTDEICRCAPGTFRSCFTFIAGPCNIGRMYCLPDGSQYDFYCEPQPSPEVCGNGLDEDCNLIADDGCP